MRFRTRCLLVWYALLYVAEIGGQCFHFAHFVLFRKRIRRRMHAAILRPVLLLLFFSMLGAGCVTPRESRHDHPSWFPIDEYAYHMRQANGGFGDLALTFELLFPFSEPGLASYPQHFEHGIGGFPEIYSDVVETVFEPPGFDGLRSFFQHFP